MDPKEIFKHRQTKKPVPTFRELLACRTGDDIKQLQVSQDKVHVDSYAIFPPALAEELFDEDNMDPAFIIMKVINKINLLYAIQYPDKIDLTEETTDGTKDGEDAKMNDSSGVEETGPHPLEESYARMVYFLYFTMMSSNLVESTKMMICMKSGTPLI